MSFRTPNMLSVNNNNKIGSRGLHVGIAVYYSDTYNTQMRAICRLYIAADDIDRLIRQSIGHY